MKRNLMCLVGLAGLVCAPGASVAQQMKPGLWEVANKMKLDPAMEAQMEQSRKQIAAMPPEQRKQMEAAMAKAGVKMDTGSGSNPGGGMSIKMCLTKEDVERNSPPGEMKSDCKSEMNRSGNVMKMTFSCPNPPSSGVGVYTFTNNENYTMKMNVTSTVSGTPKSTEMSGAGRWLGADCQGVQPVSQRAKK